jgi:hypothetical protein
MHIQSGKNIMNKLEKWLIFWTLFIGVGALSGAAMMWIDPSGKMWGMDAILPAFQVLPFAECLFQNFVFAGLALLLINGIPQLATAIMLLKHCRFAAVCAFGCGILLMLWICIQFIIFPFNFMSSIYFVFGLIEFISALKLLREK